ncbi:hypothetical protein BDF21DRAFT_485628, partial [Thamnidium elegans]
WRHFWALKIPLSARKIWYHFIHKKIATKSILHHFMDSIHPSPTCTLCSTPIIEHPHHFVYSCPNKLAVWRSIVDTYLEPTPSPIPNFFVPSRDPPIFILPTPLGTILSLCLNCPVIKYLLAHSSAYGKFIGVSSSMVHHLFFRKSLHLLLVL